MNSPLTTTEREQMNEMYAEAVPLKVRAKPIDEIADAGWTKSDIKQAIENLEYRILYEDEAWDENLEGWRGDLHADLETIALQYVQGKIDRDDALGDMRAKTFDAVRRYAEDEVNRDPNKYCEAE